MAFKVTLVSTSPIDGQKPGTSGLRKKVRRSKSPSGIENEIDLDLDPICLDLKTRF